MKPIRLLNLGLITPLQTQAYYHALAENMTVDSADTIIICRPSAPYLCLGYHQVFGSTFDRNECERRGLPVFRRRLGGGATYLDENQLFYQCIFHHTRLPAMLQDIYALALAAPVNTLKRLGLDAELRDTNEIEVNGKRIAGTGGGRIDEACVVVGNLLFDFDYEAMTAVWQTPSPTFRITRGTGFASTVDNAQSDRDSGFDGTGHRDVDRGIFQNLSSSLAVGHVDD
jgi:lipoate---protein ligase